MNEQALFRKPGVCILVNSNGYLGMRLKGGGRTGQLGPFCHTRLSLQLDDLGSGNSGHEQHHVTGA